jgi:hypothetical protein
MDPHQEILVVVADGDRYQEAVERWRRVATVTQLLPPRLALLILEPGVDPPHVPGTRWYIDDVPADVLLDLTPTERIFVAAWRDRRSAKVRRGDGLTWDTRGFEPPDMPVQQPPPRDGSPSDR